MLKQIWKLLTPGDKVLVLFLIGLSCSSLFLFKHFEQPGEMAFITAEATQTYRKSLTHDGQWVLHGAVGKSVIEISDGSIRIVDSDCPQRLCVHQGAIRRVGGLIVCVPNKITIWIEGKRQDIFDAIAG